MSTRLGHTFAIVLMSAISLGLAADSFAPGSTHHLVFQDVDGNELSTNDGHVTILTTVTRADEEAARTVADLMPDRYVGDENYRYITLVNFEDKLAAPFRGLTRAIIRNRLTAEADGLKPQYEAKKIARDPRRDLHVIADFDGSAAAQLGLPTNAGGVAVFVFDGIGKLVALWREIPTGDSLAKAVAEAEVKRQ